MSAFKGTPGPWRFERVKLRSPGSPTFIQVVADDGPVVPWTGFDSTDRGKRENAHNARLIAAAPELLEVCQKFSALFGALWDTVDPEGGGFLSPESVEKYDAVHAEMSAAIAKATGGDA